MMIGFAVSPFLISHFSFHAEKSSHCLFGLLVHRNLTFSATNCLRHKDVSAHKNHYKTLELTRHASAKDIKAAFFKLSKKHHPDMNPEDKSKSSETFQNLTEAYEVLGSEEKRQIYDALTEPKPHVPFGGTHRRTHTTHKDLGNAERHKDWTDLDIDFRDFEHFQRENRRRQKLHNWNSTTTNTESFWASYQNSKGYKSPEVLERDEMEKRLHAELMERRRKMSLPTFDELKRRELREKQKKAKERMKNYIIMIPITLFLLFLTVRH